MKRVPANADKILELVFSGGTALAGLILVFLSASLASFDTYTPTEKGRFDRNTGDAGTQA
jgi:hypothetical protein